MKKKPSSNAQSDADRRAYDAIFNRNMYVTRLVYRVPFFILELFLIVLFTVLIPIVAGRLLIAAMDAVQPENSPTVRSLVFWCLGLVAIGGASITIFVISAVWSALKDAAVRLWKLIRKADEKVDE